jgi:predicted methyltransferase
LDVYEFFGVQPGQTVADVFNADGYNTHLLSRAVGDAGRVYSVFEFYGVEELFDGQFYKVPAVTQRLDDAGLDNVELAIHLTEVPSDSVDVAIAIRNYHDVEWVFPDLKRTEQVAEFFRVVKPGGFVGIVEVSTPVEGWDNAAHRLNRQVVIDDFTAAGFELAEESDLLANPADDHAQQGFPERHKTDRYTLKFRKPGS